MGRSIWTVPVALVTAVACGGEQPRDRVAATNALAAGVVLEVPACQPSDGMPLENRASPYDSTVVTIGEGHAKICYGRPSLRGRQMIGGQAVPYGRIWRTGANEPTTIHVNVPARIAGLAVEPGAYSLYTIPAEGAEWTLIVNRSTSQWGHESRYTEEVAAQEVGRAAVAAEAMASPVEQLTIRPAEDRPGVLLEWQTTRVHIPIEPAS
jgi:hypothetical protein